MSIQLEQPTPEFAEHFFAVVSPSWPLPDTPYFTAEGIHAICSSARTIGHLGPALAIAAQEFLEAYPEALQGEVFRNLWLVPDHDTSTAESSMAMIYAWLVTALDWLNLGKVTMSSIMEFPTRYLNIRLNFAEHIKGHGAFSTFADRDRPANPSPPRQRLRR